MMSKNTFSEPQPDSASYSRVIIPVTISKDPFT